MVDEEQDIREALCTASAGIRCSAAAGGMGRHYLDVADLLDRAVAVVDDRDAAESRSVDQLRRCTAELERATDELREELAETRRLLEAERIDSTELRELMWMASPCEDGSRDEYCENCNWNGGDYCAVDGEPIR